MYHIYIFNLLVAVMSHDVTIPFLDYCWIIGTHRRNPYCRVGIVNQKHYRPGSDFKFMTEWQKHGDVSEVATTAFQTATLEPTWNEDVEL